MKNPFAYSNFVMGAAFCNRTEEQKELLNFIKSSQNVLIYSHRRKGKSSLIKQVFQNIKESKLNIGMVYIDLYGTTSEKDFIKKSFEKLNALEFNTDKLLSLLKKSLSNLTFKIGIDPGTNSPTISPSFDAIEEDTAIKGLMALIDSFAKKRKIVVAFDEFQEIGNYRDSKSFEKRLRSYIQTQDTVCYIFSGSQQHLLTEMFRSSKRAFYQQAVSFPLKDIETKHYVLWMDNLFKNGGFELAKKDLKAIVEEFKNHPMYIQLFCFLLWEELKTTPWTDQTTSKIEKLMIEQKQLEYQILWDNLSSNQKKVLKLVVFNKGKKLFSAKGLTLVDVKTASAVSKSLKDLMNKEILVKNGNYNIQDILLTKWLKMKL